MSLILFEYMYNLYHSSLFLKFCKRNIIPFTGKNSYTKTTRLKICSRKNNYLKKGRFFYMKSGVWKCVCAHACALWWEWGNLGNMLHVWLCFALVKWMLFRKGKCLDTCNCSWMILYVLVLEKLYPLVEAHFLSKVGY